MTNKPLIAPKTDESRSAVRFARSETRSRSQDWERMCLRFVRKCWGVAKKYDTAREARLNVKKFHKWNGDVDSIPHGAPVFSRRPNAGPDDSEHVFIACGYYDDVRIFRSNDIKADGFIDACAINLFVERWGHEILGWSEDINGVELNLPPAPASVKTKKPAKKAATKPVTPPRKAAQSAAGTKPRTTTKKAAEKR